MKKHKVPHKYSADQLSQLLDFWEHAKRQANIGTIASEEAEKKIQLINKEFAKL